MLLTRICQLNKATVIHQKRHRLMNTKEEGGQLFSGFPPVTTSEWEEQIRLDLKGADYEKKLVWKTDDGLSVRPYYRAEDIEGITFLDSLPGQPPFVRGTTDTGNKWEIRQEIRVDDKGLANRLAIEAIERGAGAIGFRVKEIESMEDLSDLIRYIELEKTAVHFSAAREYPYVAELFIRIMRLRGANPALVKGSLAFDPFSYYLLHGDFYNSLSDNLNEAKYLITTLGRELPAFRMIHVSANLFHNAGAGVVQELGYALASGNEYLSRLTGAGLAVDDVASRMHFTFALGSDYFMEIAKLRAARLLWSAIVDAYGPEKSGSAAMYIHGTTSLWNKTVFDPYVNMLRATTETMSGALGGCNSISVNPFDQVFRHPDTFSMRMARNTQIILKEESYLDRVADPAAGSYYIEKLTDSIASAAWDLFRKVEREGGFLEVVQSGALRADIESTAAAKSEKIARRSTFILGTNQYPNSQEQMLDKLTTDPIRRYPGLTLYRGAESWENLRLATERYVKGGHPRPGVFLLNIGNVTMRKARASFASNFFGCAGYSIIDNNGFSTAGEGVEAALASGARIVVLCSSDEEYATLGAGITKMLKHSDDSPLVVVAGNPSEAVDALTEAGVDAFIHLRTNALEALRNFHTRLGVVSVK
jgi:methylmalonyl-CoA mutase